MSDQNKADDEKSPKEIAADIARELREHPERWYQGEIAGDEDGNEVEDYNDPRAVCWCIEGHIQKRTRGYLKARVFDAFRDAAGERRLHWWNDHQVRDVAEVIALCDKVAAS